MRTFKIFILFAVIAALIPGCYTADIKPKEPVDWVNQYMGNISHLLVPTYPTIHLPNSLLRVYPERDDYTGSLLRGLPVVLTSHRGSFAFNISPFQGDVEGIKPVISYSYDLEKITPYSYSVFLDEQQIGVQFAPSHKSALYEMDFAPGKPVCLVINSRNGQLKYRNLFNAQTGFFHPKKWATEKSSKSSRKIAPKRTNISNRQSLMAKIGTNPGSVMMI